MLRCGYVGCFAWLLVVGGVTGAAVADDVVGPIVGTVESTSAHVLYRPRASQTKLRLSVVQDGQTVATVPASTKPDDDFVAKFEVTGLQPATTYHYQIDELGPSPTMLVPADSAHHFTTASPARKDNRVSISFVSCVDIEPNGIWPEMDALDVDTAFLMGDTPYIDKSDLKTVRQKHRQFLQQPDLASLAAHTPMVGTWDDHDFGRNNGNGRNLLEGKPNTRKGFVDYRAHSQYGNGREGVYHKVDLGMIEVFLLDPRYFSQTEPSPVDPSKPTCFGADQWEWLLTGLRQSKAPFKVLAMGAIWQDKKNTETDDMFTYWYERDALLDIVKSENIDGVVLLGGDIHVARHLMHPQRVGYDLHDFVISPGHTRTITELDVYHPSLQWSLVEGWQFLTMTAEETDESAKLIVQFRQPGGVINRTVTIAKNQMTAATDRGAVDGPRAHWPLDDDFTNQSKLGDRIDAAPVHGATLKRDSGIIGGAVRLHRDQQQYLNVPRSFLDDNSAAYSVSLWFKPTSLPAHDSSSRSFLLESTAEGQPENRGAWSLSLGLRSADTADQVNLQLFTSTLQPGSLPEAAPTAISQGPFDTLVDRDRLMDQWNHVAFTFDSQSLSLFLNGERVARHPLPIPGPTSEFGGLIIGGHRNGVGRNFDGWIDEVSIWQRSLTQSELAKLSDAKASLAD
ncbi:Alkaline phosphatase D precursor [Rubripirellula lacrimiformis]|uniref:Alkaline phosphatase D n=2 Tax=Rubripirellula lacrimiformis TaxID=1930273 RepID=A0A517NJD1_9BACT|nr:Alkaline phosphatase D precursor [Rubripirellula lacrimiformis]